ncbi:hypothetical protein BRAO375_2450003 [Bradyrhizobium sp. ORS 375]|nr:hypothetical protein BRAO375_2450003 [Bradyrhizobium sp. ORS 375]
MRRRMRQPTCFGRRSNSRQRFRERSKIPDRALNVCPGGHDRRYVGAVIPSPRLYAARAPIHPKRPIWLEPSGCPPGRLFRFGTRLFENGRSRKRRGARTGRHLATAADDCSSAQVLARALPERGRTRRITSRVVTSDAAVLPDKPGSVNALAGAVPG